MQRRAKLGTLSRVLQTALRWKKIQSFRIRTSGCEGILGPSQKGSGNVCRLMIRFWVIRGTVRAEVQTKAALGFRNCVPRRSPEDV